MKIGSHKLPDTVEHLRTVVVCGIRVPIVRATADEVLCLRDDDGSLLDGYFDGERGVIFVRRGLAPELERDAINHEVLHALIRYSGAKDFLRGVLRRGPDVDEHEETFVRILTPHLTALRWIS